MKHTKKIGKKASLFLVLIVALAITATAVLMGYYLNYNEISADAGVILEYSVDDVNWENAEDLDKSWDLGSDFCGADVETHTFFIKCNADLDSALNVTWTISDVSTDDPEGLTIQLQYNDGGFEDIINWEATDGGSASAMFEFNHSDDIEFKIIVTGHDYLKEGDYGFLLELEATSEA